MKRYHTFNTLLFASFLILQTGLLFSMNNDCDNVEEEELIKVLSRCTRSLSLTGDNSASSDRASTCSSPIAPNPETMTDADDDSSPSGKASTRNASSARASTSAARMFSSCSDSMQEEDNEDDDNNIANPEPLPFFNKQSNDLTPRKHSDSKSVDQEHQTPKKIPAFKPMIDDKDTTPQKDSENASYQDRAYYDEDHYNGASSPKLLNFNEDEEHNNDTHNLIESPKSHQKNHYRKPPQRISFKESTRVPSKINPEFRRKKMEEQRGQSKAALLFKNRSGGNDASDSD